MKLNEEIIEHVILEVPKMKSLRTIHSLGLSDRVRNIDMVINVLEWFICGVRLKNDMPVKRVYSM